MDKQAAKAASLLSNSTNCVVLTGAGISVESGIPPFRGQHGLWERYDPMEFAHISAFKSNPGRVWEMLEEMISLFFEARPNDAHIALAKLEEMGIVRSVITQNIDGLHQMAGSTRVIEYHGNAWQLVCTDCMKRYPTKEKVMDEIPPLCLCGTILKPDVIFFGEPIPKDASRLALESASKADLFMVIGTSGTVAPANEIPFLALQRNIPVIILNPEKNDLTEIPGTIWLQETAQKSLKKIIPLVEKESFRD